jgi:hypothetical protein
MNRILLVLSSLTALVFDIWSLLHTLVRSPRQWRGPAAKVRATARRFGHSVVLLIRSFRRKR